VTGTNIANRRTRAEEEEEQEEEAEKEEKEDEDEEEDDEWIDTETRQSTRAHTHCVPLGTMDKVTFGLRVVIG
jgi:hypothetical protein